MISVLYVDDETALLEIGKRFLERGGLFSVDTVESASEALLYITEKGYDAIISDYQMPGMDGIEFLKKVRASGNNVPFIIFTGRGREEVVIEALNEGVDFYLQKGGEPVSQFAELAHKIQKAVLQRRAEASIRDHERRESDIINFLPDATFAIDNRGVVIAWNRAMEKMTGIPSLDILGKGNHEYGIPFYRERRPILIDLVLKDDPVTEAKYPYITRSGEKLFSEITIPHMNDGKGAALWFTASPLYDTKGCIIGAIESIRDITERKEAEWALNESEMRFRELSDLLPQAVYEADAEGILTYANRIAFDMFRYTQEEFNAGLHALDMIAPEDRERAEAGIRGVFEGKPWPGLTGEYMALRKDGNIFPISIYSSPVHVNDRITGLRGIIVDITERKEAEVALAKSGARLRRAELIAGLGHWEFDLKTRDVYASDGARSIYGLSNHQWCIEDVQEIPLPEYRPILNEALRALIEDNRPYDVEFKIERPTDGKIVDVHSIAEYNPVMRVVFGVIQDITERKQADEAIRGSEEKYRAVFETTGTATVLIENDGMISLANSEFERLSGYRKGEIENKKKWMEFVVKEDLDRMLAQHRLRRVDHKSALAHYEFRFISRSGEIRDIYITIDVIPGTSKSVASLLDITELKRVEENLITANREYTGLLSQIQDVYYRSDTEGRLLRVSRSFATLLGYNDISECLGRNIANDFYLNPADRKQFLEEVYRNGKVTDYEIRLRRKDGKGVAISTSSHLYYDPAGNILGVEGTFRDITERKQRDHLLRTQLNLGTALQSVRGLNSTMMTCLNAAIEISGMDAGGIYLVDGISGSIDLIVSQNLGDEFMQSVSRYPSGSENARMIMAGKPIYVQYSKKGIIHSPVQEQEGLKVAAIIPILHNSRVIASLNITSHTMYEIPAIARVALEMIATQIGSAIERIRADEALIESEQRYRDVVEDQTEFISRFLPDGTHIFVNEAYCRYFGLKREAILGHRFRPEIPVEDQERVRQFFESLTPGNPVDTIVHRIIMPDGGIRWQRWSDRANFDPFGTITEYQSVGRDITHTKEAEIALQASEARYRTLLTSVNEGIWVIDTDAVTTYVNPIMAGMLGYTVDEMVGKGLFMFMDEAWRAVAAGKFSERKEGASEQHEFRFQKKDGSYITTLMSTAPLHNTDGSFAGGIATVIDIGRRKGTEDALRESEERLHTIMQSVQTGIIIIDAATHIILDANPKALAMIGAGTEDEVIGSVCHQFICPCELGQCPIADLGQEIDASERVLVTNQGEHIPVLKTVIPAIINGKKVLVESLSDISEQQQIAGALRVSEEKYRLLFEKSNDAIFIADPKTRMLIDCNERAEVITGYSRQEINSMRADQLHPEDVLEKTMEYFQKYALGMDTSVESAIITKDNRRVPVSINASRVDITGRTSIIGIFRDITDQKRAEDVLRQRTEELDYRNRLISTLLDTVPMGIFMVEAPSGRPIIANREATRLLGRGIMSDATEENLADIYNASRAGTSVPYPAKDMPIIRGMHGELSYVDDMVVERPDGTRVRLEIYGTPIFDNQDRIVASLVSFLDITDRKRTEQVIRETNRKINLLASITRHDVANQVTILKGYAQIALMEQPDPVVADLLSKIEAAGSIISRVIEFTRSYQELGMHAPGWYRVSEMVSRHKPENIQISCTCDAEVFADPMLEKVFFNLIDNSIRHGERVTVIRIRCEQEMDGLTITVEDDGTGVPPDCKEKIFLKGYGKNTGFGLFLAREILAITSITIRETGEPGKGAVFTITVPKGSYRITAPV